MLGQDDPHREKNVTPEYNQCDRGRCQKASLSHIFFLFFGEDLDLHDDLLGGQKTTATMIRIITASS